MALIVVDTTILVYSVGSEHPLRAPCRSLIEAVGDGQIAATTTVEVIQEFAHVRARRRSRADARAFAANFADLLSPLLLPDADDLARGMDLFVSHDRLGAFDAILAASVIGRDHLTSIVSADQAFDEIPALHHVDPADASALGILLST
jgi:uncharacterized protein